MTTALIVLQAALVALGLAALTMIEAARRWAAADRLCRRNDALLAEIRAARADLDAMVAAETGRCVADLERLAIAAAVERDRFSRDVIEASRLMCEGDHEGARRLMHAWTPKGRLVA